MSLPTPSRRAVLRAGPFRSNTSRTHTYLEFPDADRLPGPGRGFGAGYLFPESVIDRASRTPSTGGH